MGTLSKASMTTCELKFHPFGELDVNKAVDAAIDIIKSYDFDDVRVTPLSTLVKGQTHEVMALIQELYQTMDKDYTFALTITLSNHCA